MSVDPNIKQKATYIRTKQKGSEVRESLAAGLESMSEDVVETVDRQDYVEQQLQAVHDSTRGKDVISATEILASQVGADGTKYNNMKERLDAEQNKVTAQLAQKANINYVDALLMDIAKGGPKGLFNSLALLKSEYPSGAEGTWLVFDSSFTDGAHSFMWDSTILEWRDLGVYQATGLDKDTQKKLDDSYKGINEIATKIETEVGKSYKEPYEASHPTSSWYGWKNGFKPMSFKRVILTDNVTDNISSYTCQIMTKDSEIVAEQTINSNGNGANIEIIFTFPEIITMRDDFFIAIKSTEFVSFVATAGYNSTLVSDTLKTSGWLNGASWSDLGNFSHIMQLKFLSEEFKVNELVTNGDGRKVLSDNGTYKTLDELENGTVTQIPLESLAPRHLYSVRNDLEKDRNYPVTIYVDHTIKAPDYNLDVAFENGEYDKTLYSGHLSNDKETQAISILFKSRTFITNAINTALRKVKLSSAADDEPKILFIADSNGFGDQNTDYLNNKINLVMKTKQLFEMDKIDNGGIGGGLVLGETAKYTFPINYKGETYNIDAFTSGRSGWTAYGLNGHIKNYYPNQTNWDLLGLGDGSETDYTGSQEQKELFASTLQDSSAYLSPDDNRMIWNGYHDNSKTGDSKFSLAKWLERFRTMDDNGNRLNLGEGTGTHITANNINDIGVCKPTHIVIQVGQNDMDQGISNVGIRDNVRRLVNSIKAEYPEIIVVVAYCDRPGTIFPNANGYPAFDCRINRGAHDRTYDLIKLLMEEFPEYEEAQGVYFCPNYFTQATADGMSYQEVIDPVNGQLVGKVKSDEFGPDAHPSWHACADWAYQIYSLIRWTQT